MPEDPEVFHPMTNLTWTCGKCGRACSWAFLDCAGCGENRDNRVERGPQPEGYWAGYPMTWADEA